MAFDKLLLYEQGYSIEINEPTDELYYLFDYDERSYSINMDFQHFHSFYEIHILLDQKAAHIIEGDYYAIQPYDMVFLRPALLHKTEYPQGKPKKRLIINFSIPKSIPGLSEATAKMFSIFDGTAPIYRFSENHSNHIFDLINDIFNLGKANSDINNLAIHAKFMEFLCAVYNEKQHNCYVPQELSDSITHKIYTITAFIHANYAQEMSLQDISKKFFISSHYLSHQFKYVTGFTLINYIQMTRIRNAQQLLLYTDLKITEIAEACGFTSFSQFNRVFNKFCECSPSQFRIHAELNKDRMVHLE